MARAARRRFRVKITFRPCSMVFSCPVKGCGLRRHQCPSRVEGRGNGGASALSLFPPRSRVPDWLPPSVSVSLGEWKLIRIFYAGEEGAHRYLLYDLAKDPGESTNLASREPFLIAEPDGLIEGFRVETNAVVPALNSSFDRAAYRPEIEDKQQPKGKAKGTSRRISRWGCRKAPCAPCALIRPVVPVKS